MSKRIYTDCESLIAALEAVASSGSATDGSARRLDVGSRGYLDFFSDEILERLLRGGGSTLRVFEGPYGAGKTHLLGLVSELGRAKDLVVARVDLSTLLGFEEQRLLVSTILERMEWHGAESPSYGMPHVLENAHRARRISSPALEAAQLPHTAYKNAMLHLIGPAGSDDDKREILHDFIRGEKVAAWRLDAFGLRNVRDPLSNPNAEQVLFSACNGLFDAGMPGVLLVFDETERTLHRDTQRTRIAANFLRRLIDATTTGRLRGTCIVFAVLPDFIEACSAVYPALGQRLHAPNRQGGRVGWRSPVLSVEDANEFDRPEAFLTALVDHLLESATACGVDRERLSKSLWEAGHEAITRQAGSGYRRELIKNLAVLTLDALE